jgi:hypothetical protein
MAESTQSIALEFDRDPTIVVLGGGQNTNSASGLGEFAVLSSQTLYSGHAYAIVANSTYAQAVVLDPKTANDQHLLATGIFDASFNQIICGGNDTLTGSTASISTTTTYVTLYKRKVWFTNSGTSAIIDSSVGQICFFENGETVSKIADVAGTNTAPKAGLVLELNSDKSRVLVDMTITTL